MIVWQESDVMDYRRFPARPVPTHPPAFHFLRSTGTTALLVLEGDTLRYEAYLNGYRADSTFSSFSVAKPVVSALVGIAIAQGRIGSVQDPSPATCPSWPAAIPGSAASPSSTCSR